MVFPAARAIHPDRATRPVFRPVAAVLAAVRAQAISGAARILLRQARGDHPAARRFPADEAIPPAARAATSFPSGKSYSSGESEHAAFGTRPSHGNYDSSAGALKQREASRAAYTKGQTPRSTYVDPVGKAQPVNPESPVVRQLRNDLDYERWRNREYRERQYYGNYWSGWNYARPVYYYHDPFSNLFWYWLLSQNYNTQAQWAYNHYDMMDSARYRDLLAHDARIEQEINTLRQQGVRQIRRRPRRTCRPI